MEPARKTIVLNDGQLESAGAGGMRCQCTLTGSIQNTKGISLPEGAVQIRDWRKSPG